MKKFKIWTDKRVDSGTFLDLAIKRDVFCSSHYSESTPYEHVVTILNSLDDFIKNFESKDKISISGYTIDEIPEE